jgi:hypothetical protein
VATPRSRWMRISDLELDEDWDDATLATVIRLLAWMRQRWAKERLTHEQAVEAVISSREAVRITHLKRDDRALARLESLGTLAGLGSYTGRIEKGLASESVRIRWPKVAEYQGWDALEPGTRRPARAPSVSRLPSPVSREEKEEEKSERLAPLAPEILVRLLSKEPGDEATKLAWLTAELPTIELLADEDHPTDSARRMAAVRSRVLRHYRQHQKNREASPDASPLTLDRVLKLVDPKRMGA